LYALRYPHVTQPMRTNTFTTLCLSFLLMMLLATGATAQQLDKDDLRRTTDAVKTAPADTNRVALLITLARHYAESAGHTTARDSALLLSNQADALSKTLHYDTGVIRSGLAQAMAWIRFREAALNANDDNAEAFRQVTSIERKLVQYLTEKKATLQLGHVYMELSYSYRKEIMPTTAERIRLREAALRQYQAAGSKRMEAKAFCGLGDILQEKGDLTQSKEYFLKGIAIYREIGETRLQWIYAQIANVENFLGNFTAGLKYGQEAERMALETHDTTKALIDIYNSSGISYQALKDFDRALEYFRKTLAVVEKYHDAGEINHMASNIAVVLQAKHDPAASIEFQKDILRKYPLAPDNLYLIAVHERLLSAYGTLKRFEEARESCNELLRISAVLPATSPWQMRIYVALIRFFVEDKQYSRARTYLIKNEPLVRQYQVAPYLRLLYLNWHKVDSASGDYLSALRHYMAYTHLNDSLYDASKTREIAQMEIQFETEKKEQSIVLLTKEAQLKEEELRQAGLVRNGTIGGIIILIILLGLGFNQYQLKQKVNREINSKNVVLQRMVDEKEWLLKEIHHRVKNNLQTVVSLLESQAAYLKNSEALSAIQDSQNRVNAMSLIHQKLYLGDNIASIDVRHYLQELMVCLRESFDIRERIRFELHVAAIELDVSQAIPIGLILNEAITNCIKYAFPEPGGNNLVVIHMHQSAGRTVHLSIADNGAGFPDDFDPGRDGCGLGLRLMQGLTEDIEGKFSVRSDRGVTIEVSFVASPLLENQSKETDVQEQTA
jgi:two-component sensor histidine kinase/tetratricopeptide (TPR) repeat protein